MVEGIRRGINAFGVAECRWLPESFLEAFRADEEICMTERTVTVDQRRAYLSTLSQIKLNL